MNKKPRQVLPLLVNVPVVERIIIPQNRIVCFHHAVMMKVYLVYIIFICSFVLPQVLANNPDHVLVYWKLMTMAKKCRFSVSNLGLRYIKKVVMLTQVIAEKSVATSNCSWEVAQILWFTYLSTLLVYSSIFIYTYLHLCEIFLFIRECSAG